MKLQKGDFVKFHARYGGESPLHQGFSLGISNHEPETIIAAGIEKVDHFLCFRSRSLVF
jgi:uncharacterized protein YneR